MPGFKWICPAILALLAASASATTPEQAQTLSVAELARLVLGEAGVLVVDVDRPKWSTCEIGCLPLTEEQLARTPPLHSLTFYTRPGMGWSSDKWRGLCGVKVIGVSFRKDGQVAGMGIRYVWASPLGMKRVTTGVTQADLAAENEQCHSAGDPRTFFASDDIVGLTAFRVAVAAELFAETVGRGAPLPFTFKCKSDFEECEDRAAKAVATTFRPANIAEAEQVDCADRYQELLSVAARACYHVSLRGDGEHLYLELADAFSELRIKRIEYNHGMIIVD